MIEIFERLAAANIELLPVGEISTHFVFGRDGFVCLVERRGDGFGGMGSPGLLSDRGMAFLVWRGGAGYFVNKAGEMAASAEQVSGLRAFSADLSFALTGLRAGEG